MLNCCKYCCRRGDYNSVARTDPETAPAPPSISHTVSVASLKIATSGPSLKRQYSERYHLIDDAQNYDDRHEIEHDLDTVDNYILIERVKDTMDEYELNYDDEYKKIEEAMRKKYQIEIHDTLLHHRIQNIIFDLQKQNGINQEPLHLLRTTYALSICTDSDLELNTESKKAEPQTPFLKHDDIKSMYTDEMDKLLEKYTQNTRKIECNDEKCNERIKQKDDIYACPCIKRICVFLKIYHRFYVDLNTIAIPSQLCECFERDDYDYVALSDDFQHIQYHMLNNHEMQKRICAEINTTYPCKHTSKQCEIATRRARHAKRIKPIIGHNKLFTSKLDDLHAYFLHSDLKKGCRNEQCLDTKDHKATDEKEETNNKDSKWLKKTDNIPVEKENKIYKTLARDMGAFTWQSSTGFTANHPGAQVLAHIKPKHDNVKDEILHNIFETLTLESWNQIVRQSQYYSKTFACRKIQTKQNDSYIDQVFGHEAKWERGVIPTVKEIVVLKLYTDFDALQTELKKCFRLDDMEDIFRKYTLRGAMQDIPSPEAMEKAKSAPVEHLSPRNSSPVKKVMVHKRVTAKWDPPILFRAATSYNSCLDDNDDHIFELEQRLEEFYHWRGKLILFLHKFATILTPNGERKEFVLYHGINTKMLLNPSATQSFHGPVSTTSSYHVAATFATKRGMVLTITSQYPRLNMCKAFDASLMSNYPEEQEWLIAHIYMRVRKISTRYLQKHTSMASWIKFSFFAIHLFRQQMFSMSEALERSIIPFLQIHLFKVAQAGSIYGDLEISDVYRYFSKIIKSNDVQSTKEIPKLNKELLVDELNEKDQDRYNKITYVVLLRKFEEFCKVPNRMQTVKIDCISDGLKRYFLDCANNEDKTWSVSFKKILNLFPNIQEIHFFNCYRFDNDVLEKLTAQIYEKSRLRQIKFLYYDYEGKLTNHPFFFNPKDLDSKLVKKLESNPQNPWKIFYPRNLNPKNGYCIRLKPLRFQ